PSWRAMLEGGPDPLPADEAGTRDTVGASATVWSEMDEDLTRALLRDVPGIYHTQIPDVLLTALVEAFAGWTGRDRLLVEVEGHGREDLFEGVDVSRTVGWFTTAYPVRLLRAPGGPGERLQAVKEQLRSVPERGIGYGLLRELDPRGREWCRHPGAEVSFNYLGQFDQVLASSTLLRPA